MVFNMDFQMYIFDLDSGFVVNTFGVQYAFSGLPLSPDLGVL